MEEDKSEVDPKYILDLPLAYPSLKFHSNYQLDSQLIWLEFEPYTSSVKNSGIVAFRVTGAYRGADGTLARVNTQ